MLAKLSINGLSEAAYCTLYPDSKSNLKSDNLFVIKHLAGTVRIPLVIGTILINFLTILWLFQPLWSLSRTKKIDAYKKLKLVKILAPIFRFYESTVILSIEQ